MARRPKVKENLEGWRRIVRREVPGLRSRATDPIEDAGLTSPRTLDHGDIGMTEHRGSRHLRGPARPAPRKETAMPASTTRTDRLAEPWGPRTPYASGDAWPVRVDTFLDAGVTPEQVDRWVQSACVLCSNGCGMDIAVAGGRMAGVRGRADDRVNHGRLGPKGLF